MVVAMSLEPSVGDSARIGGHSATGTASVVSYSATAVGLVHSVDESEDVALSNNLPIVYLALEACVAVCAVFGNLLVIVVFLQDRRLRKVTNFYIISLSLADLLVGAIGIPSAILTRIGMPRNSIRLCLTMLSLLVVLCTISILNLVAVSLDRYWAILHPLDYHKKISEKTALVIVCICWILGLMIGFLPLFGWNNDYLARDECFFIPIMNYDFLVFLYFVTIVLPALVMAFFYIRIYIVVVQQLSLNKVRQLNSSELTLSNIKTSKSTGEGVSYLSGKTSKLSSPAFAGRSNSNATRYKGFKSASSPQQLNEITPVNSSGTINVAHDPVPTPDSFFGSFALFPIRQCAKSTDSPTLISKSRIECDDSEAMSSEQALNQTCSQEKTNGRERKWISLWSMRNLNEGLGSDKVTIERKGTTGSSVLSSFYRNTNGDGSRLNYSRREVKKAQMLFVIVVFFMLCWLPLYTSNTIQAFCNQCSTPSSTWLDFLIILSHINSAGSPFLYAFHMKDFRQALRRLICKGAINKRKLRDLRREELFSISGRRPNATVGLASVARSRLNDVSPEGKTISNYHLHKGHAVCSHSLKVLHSKNDTNSESAVQQLTDLNAMHRSNNVPWSFVKVETDLLETKEE